MCVLLVIGSSYFIINPLTNIILFLYANYSNYQQRKANNVFNVDQDLDAIQLLRFLVACKQAYNQHRDASVLRMRFEDSSVAMQEQGMQGNSGNLFFKSMFQSSTYKSFHSQLNVMRKVGNSVASGKNSGKMEKLREVSG